MVAIKVPIKRLEIVKMRRDKIGESSGLALKILNLFNRKKAVPVIDMVIKIIIKTAPEKSRVKNHLFGCRCFIRASLPYTLDL
jgi:hypothetical protein